MGEKLVLTGAGNAQSMGGIKSAGALSARIWPYLGFAQMVCALRILLVSVFLAGSAIAQAATTFPIANTPGHEMSLSAAFDGTNFLVGIQGDATAKQSITINADTSPVTGIATGPAQAQHTLRAMRAMHGSAQSAPNRRHRPVARKEQD